MTSLLYYIILYVIFIFYKYDVRLLKIKFKIKFNIVLF